MSSLAVTDDISTSAAVEIAVVLESATNRRIVRNALQLIGYNQISSFGEASPLIEHLNDDNEVDLIITGKSLPDLRGGNLAKEVRRNSDQVNVPMLMVGYQFTEDDVLHAVDRGINAFLLMPFSPEALQEKLESIAGSS